MKYSSQKDFVDRMEREHTKLLDLTENLPKKLLTAPGAWGEDWTIKDLFAHLTEWEQMFLGWYQQGLEGIDSERPAPGYKWNETPRLNADIWKKHKNKSWVRIRRDFDASYQEMLSLAKSLTDKKLLEAGYYPWTAKYPLTTYFGANSCSHYSVASKILKRWIKQHG